MLSNVYFVLTSPLGSCPLFIFRCFVPSRTSDFTRPLPLCSQTPLCVSLFTSSRDDRYFPAPLEFLPERWLRLEGRGAPTGCPVHGGGEHGGEHGEHGPYAGSVHTENGLRHRHACMPFAGGVRGCIGKRVAELQMQLLLARLVHRFEVGVENARPAEFLMRMVGVMSDELRLRLRPRDD